MSYSCQLCNYFTNNQGNLSHHKKTKKHLKNLDINNLKCSSSIPNVAISATSATTYVVSTNIKNTDKNEKYNCEFCDKNFKHSSSYYRHIKKCDKEINQNNNSDTFKELKLKLEFAEKEKELLKKIELEKDNIIKEKSDLLTNIMSNANTIINKAQDNTKITAQAIQNVSMSALKYANEKYKAAPVLLPLENFNINDLNFEKKEDRAQLLEVLIYNAKLKSLDKLLGEHIIKNYKKDNPKLQSIHTTDCSRLNYLVRELFENVPSWEVDKNGIKICSKIIKPLIDKCIELLLDYQKELLDEMADGNYKNKDTVNAIINLLMSIDKGSLENDINKYIAPHFNIIKKD